MPALLAERDTAGPFFSPPAKKPRRMDRNYLQGLLYCCGKLHGREILFRPGETTAKILKRNDAADRSRSPGSFSRGWLFFPRTPADPAAISRHRVIRIFVADTLAGRFFPADAPARGLLELFLNGEISEACDARSGRVGGKTRRAAFAPGRIE